MKRLALMLLFASAGCAEGADGGTTGPSSLGPGDSATGDPTTDPVMMGQSTGSEDETTTTGDAEEPATGSSGEASTETIAAESSSGSSSESGMGVTSGSDLGVCEPHGTDNACFMCGRANCCEEIEECYDDAVCTCSLDCIEGGGRAQECNDMCGGLNGPSVAITLCINDQCEATCDGV